MAGAGQAHAACYEMGAEAHQNIFNRWVPMVPNPKTSKAHKSKTHGRYREIYEETQQQRQLGPKVQTIRIVWNTIGSNDY